MLNPAPLRTEPRLWVPWSVAGVAVRAGLLLLLLATAVLLLLVLLLLVVANTGILGPGRRKFGSCWVHERWTRTLDFFVRNCVVSLLFSVHDLRLVHNSGTVMMLLMIKKSKENNAYNCPPVCEQNIWKTIWGVACQLNFVHTLTQTHSWMERRVLACDERFNICTHVQIFGMQKGQFKQVSWVSWKIIFGPMRKMGENKMKTWLKDLKVLTWLNLCWLTSLGRRHNALGHGKICVHHLLQRWCFCRYFFTLRTLDRLMRIHDVPSTWVFQMTSEGDQTWFFGCQTYHLQCFLLTKRSSC